MATLDASSVIPAHQMPDITVDVKTQYIHSQSIPDEKKYVFAYHIDIYNSSHYTVQLMTRHWLITDGDGKLQEVKGEGVVGDTPILEPGQSYQYSSGAVLATEVGSMSGQYGMQLILENTDENIGDMETDVLMFNTNIPVFTLAVPSALN